jgi:hypothetical protein
MMNNSPQHGNKSSIHKATHANLFALAGQSRDVRSSIQSTRIHRKQYMSHRYRDQYENLCRFLLILSIEFMSKQLQTRKTHLPLLRLEISKRLYGSVYLVFISYRASLAR